MSLFYRGRKPLALARAELCGPLKIDVAAHPALVRVRDLHAVGLVERNTGDGAAEFLRRIGRAEFGSRRSLEEIPEIELVRGQVVGGHCSGAAGPHLVSLQAENDFRPALT